MAIAPLMGVCSSALQYDITDDGRVTGIRFAGGCPATLKPSPALLKGFPPKPSFPGLKGSSAAASPRPVLISSPAPLSVSLPRAGRNEEEAGDGGREPFKKVPFPPPPSLLISSPFY